ncbi:MAG TPA: ATP-binding protein [Planctomycetota bacterium]|nr:ATP-binding protein [Planctomycetota bacterium]
MSPDLKNDALRHERQRLLAFAVVCLSFIVSTVIAQVSMQTVHTAAMDIALNACPSIERLAAARTELRRLHLIIDDTIDQALAGRKADLEPVATSRARVQAEIVAYLKLPVFRGEQELWGTVRGDIDRLDAEIDRTLVRIARGDAQGAAARLDRELRQAFETASEALTDAIELNVARARELAVSIEQARARTVTLELALDFLSVLLAAGAFFVLSRSMRRYAALQTSHERLLRERADELEQFAGRVAHDVLGPLTTVQLALDHAVENGALDDRGHKLAGTGARSLRRVRTIVEGLLEFARSGARPEAGARSELRGVLAELAAELGLAAAEAGVKFRLEEPPAVAVACSPGVLTSLVSNLARNAIKYIGDGAERRVTVRATEREGRVLVEVEDTGPGLAPDLERAVFEPYVRASGNRLPGIGLGLATVKRLAQAHGGSVGVRSLSGRGSVFWFELPLVPRAPGGVAQAG